jgi:hypothetical protein
MATDKRCEARASAVAKARDDLPERKLAKADNCEADPSSSSLRASPRRKHCSAEAQANNSTS